MVSRFLRHPLDRAPWRLLCQAFGALLLAALAAPAAAQNLLQNARFDANASGWIPNGVGSATRSPADAHGYATSGSLEVSAENSLPSAGNPVRQCLPIAPGTYTMRAFALIPAGQLRTGTATVGFSAWTGTSCDGTQLAVNATPSVPADGAWHLLTLGATLPAGTASVRASVLVVKNEAGGAFVARFDDVYFGRPCTASAMRLCLDGNRFAVDARWRTPDGQEGAGVAIAFTGEAGWFWFFAPGNVELVVKEVDACSFNQRRWVFLSGLTNVKVDVVVTDFETGAVKTYANPQGQQFVPVLDTAAFATCP